MMAGQDLGAHVALVTGASRGYRRSAVALTLAELGARGRGQLSRERARMMPTAIVPQNQSRRRPRHRRSPPIVSQVAQPWPEWWSVSQRELGPDRHFLVNNAGIAIVRGRRRDSARE
jgi:3-oxoacyl-[acyl-carrier protein] reductase